MYGLYYLLMLYFALLFMVVFLFSLFKMLVVVLFFGKDVERINFYGYSSGLARLICLLYLPETGLSGDAYLVLMNIFFFLMNGVVYWGYTRIMVKLEKDLEDVYRSKSNSEIALFTLL